MMALLLAMKHVMKATKFEVAIQHVQGLNKDGNAQEVPLIHLPNVHQYVEMAC